MDPKTEIKLSDGSPLTPQEQFVLKQAAAGEIADLEQEFGGAEEGRRLRARFLEELLTGDLPGAQIHRRGLRIRHAVIEEPLDLENSQMAVAVAFHDCMFQEFFVIRDAFFNYHLSVDGSYFLKGADFQRLQVAGSMFCRDTVFSGLVNFAAAGIDGQFAAQGAKFLAEDQGADFSGLRVGEGAFFDEAEFHGPADFGSADIKGQFVAQGAKFLAPNHKVSFIRMQVGHDAFFQGCDFHGLVSFVLAKVAGDCYLDPLEKSGHQLAATFRSGVNFRGAVIGGELRADKAQFLGHISDFEAV